jgi:hypothetical protein
MLQPFVRRQAESSNQIAPAAGSRTWSGARSGWAETAADERSGTSGNLEHHHGAKQPLGMRLQTPCGIKQFRNKRLRVLRGLQLTLAYRYLAGVDELQPRVVAVVRHAFYADVRGQEPHPLSCAEVAVGCVAGANRERNSMNLSRLRASVKRPLTDRQAFPISRVSHSLAGRCVD